jgi:hypothetical protein
LGEDIGEATYEGASDIVGRLQSNYVSFKESVGDFVNPDHHTEMTERKTVLEQAKESPGYYTWNYVRGGWVDPVTGEVVSTDRNDPAYA